MAKKRAKKVVVDIETIRDPYSYSDRQINFACLVHTSLGRGKLIVAEEPEHKQ